MPALRRALRRVLLRRHVSNEYAIAARTDKQIVAVQQQRSGNQIRQAFVKRRPRLSGVGRTEYANARSGVNRCTLRDQLERKRRGRAARHRRPRSRVIRRDINTARGVLI